MKLAITGLAIANIAAIICWLIWKPGTETGGKSGQKADSMNNQTAMSVREISSDIGKPKEIKPYAIAGLTPPDDHR